MLLANPFAEVEAVGRKRDAAGWNILDVTRGP
jgi:hypothetical protein